MTATRFSEPTTVGFIGLGAMGAPIVRHLAGKGFDLVVFDVNGAALEAARAAGARPMGSAAEVADHARLVMVCLPSLEVARSVLLGDQGVANGRACKVLFDLSTTGPAFAREMRDAMEAKGIDYLDSPITGNVTTAGNGRLGLMCSGAASAYEQALPVLDALAGSIVLYLGEQAGRAQTLKLLNNLVSASGMALTSEAFIIATKMGLRPTMLLEAINSGDASTNASRNKFGASVLPRKFNYGARMAITAKDISLAVDEAEKLEVPVWVARSVQQVWRFAASQGGADRDGSALITYLEPWAGIEVRGDDAPAFLATPASRPIQRCAILCEADAKPGIQARLLECGLAESQVSLHDVAGDGGADSVGLGLPDGATVVNTAWMPPGQVDALALKLAGKGYGYVDAPISSRLREVGSAPLFAGGSDDDLAGVWPVLQALGQPVCVVSRTAADAQRVRLIEEALGAALFAVACESYVTAVKAGLAAQTVPCILGIETGRTAASARLFPEQVLTRRFSEGRPLAKAAQALEQLGKLAEDLGLSPWALNASRLLYRMAAAQLGGDVDVTQVVQLYENWAGVEVMADTDKE